MKDIMSTKRLYKDLTTESLTKLQGLLQEYLETKPAHNEGMCFWMKHIKLYVDVRASAGYQVGVVRASFRLMESDWGVARGLQNSLMVDEVEGPTEKRLEFAAEYLRRVQHELKARQPKVAKPPTINLRKASKQRIYEFALRHVRKQGKPGYENGSCLYRTDCGLMCAVGAMLTDAQVAKIPQPLCGVSYEDNARFFLSMTGTSAKLALLERLQIAHDTAANDPYDGASGFMRRFESNMEDVATKMGLKYKPPGESLRA